MLQSKGLVEAGHQPNYLPWLGFFDKMLQCDVFIIEDNIQLEKQGFTSRNMIKTEKGSQWLTVPIQHIGRPILINEAKIVDSGNGYWRRKHWESIKGSYSNSQFWNRYNGFFEETYNTEWKLLIDLNMHIIKGIMKFLRIDKPLVMASSLGVSGKKNELLINQCKALGATVHFSGIGGKDYLDLKSFEDEGIRVVLQEFEYPVYKQRYGNFIPNLSAIDYLFCVGDKDWRKQVTDIQGKE
jgi:hypothetical protein